MIKNHSKKESITGAVVNEKPMTAPLNLNPADETTASLGLQHAGHIIRSHPIVESGMIQAIPSFTLQTTGKPTTGTKPTNQ